MTQPELTDAQTRGLLYKALGRWRCEELAFIRRLPIDIEEKLDSLDNREPVPGPDRSEMRSKLKEQASRLAERKDQRIAMIENAYACMIEYVERLERAGGAVTTPPR